MNGDPSTLEKVREYLKFKVGQIKADEDEMNKEPKIVVLYEIREYLESCIADITKSRRT